MSGRLQLTDGPGSLNAGPFPAALGTTLAPGQSEPVTIALNRQLPDGPWKATVTLRSGLIERSAQATIRFPSGPGTTAATPAAGTSKGGSGRVITYALLPPRSSWRSPSSALSFAGVVAPVDAELRPAERVP